MQDFDSLWEKCLQLYKLTFDNEEDLKPFFLVKKQDLMKKEDSSFFISTSTNPAIQNFADGKTALEALKKFATVLEDQIKNRINRLKEEGNSLLADAVCLQNSLNKVKR